MVGEERPPTPPVESVPDIAQDDPFGALRSGSQIGKYEISEMLGQGGFGITYRARDTQLRRDVAIKEYLPASFAMRQGGTTVLPRSTHTAEDFRWGRERFLDEARTLATLEDAPGIVNVHDFMEANGTAYMVMSLVRGETLDARLKRERRLQQPAVEQLLYPLLDGLELVHEAGFLHRDIKPANILLDSSGRPTLIDFGASRVALQGRTQALTAIFTPGYAAFEQSTSARQGPWTDIYALAATLYHCITGAPPPPASDRMIEDQLVPAAEAGKGRYAPSLLAAIDAGLTLKLTDRPQSIADWRRVLSGQAAGSAASLGMPTRALDEQATRRMETPATPVARSRRTGMAWIAIGALALAIAGGGTWMYQRSQADSAQAETQRRAEQEVAARTAAAEKEAAEAEVRRRAGQEAAARKAAEDKAAADAELRRKVEQETRAKMEAEAAARQREEEQRRAAEEKARADSAARDKAEAETRARAEQEARRRAEDDARKAAEEKARAEIDARRQAEAAEAALRLGELDRRRVQIALTALGHDPRRSDGFFGPRTREMIGAWQKSQGAPETGYLTAVQFMALRQQAGPAIARFDDEQKKLEDDKRRAEEEARRKLDDDAKKRAEEERRRQQAPAAQQPATAAATPGTAAPGFDGTYRGEHCSGGRGKSANCFPVVLTVNGGVGSYTWPVRRCQATGTVMFKVDAKGNFAGTGAGYDNDCVLSPTRIWGQISGGQVTIQSNANLRATLSKN